MTLSPLHRICLLFNANKVYDRQVIEGIGHYLQTSKADWDVYLEEDCLARINNLEDWQVDGIIADFDDPDIQQALLPLSVPVVGVGSSYENEQDYPPVPYVATDNPAVIDHAFQHLRQKGLEEFAFYGFPPDPKHRWAEERERAINSLCKQEGYQCHVYRGQETRPDTWHKSMESLCEWLEKLPQPVGIIAVTDARARHLLQACERLKKPVPDQVSIVGIDDDDIARNLSRVSLSSVSQGCFEMGFQAAKLLFKRINQNNSLAKMPRVLVPPHGVVQRQSTDFKALKDPYVIQAMHYIRQRACKGIKVEQVVDYVGISRSTLEQRFRHECGQSVHYFIHQEKLQAACKELLETDKAVREIAKACGYPSLQYMYAVFNRHFGKTPTQFRHSQ